MPSLVPERETFDHTVHIVLEDFGRQGLAYREIDAAEADLKTLVADILTGQYENIVRIVAFNTVEGWSRDVTEDVAREVAERARQEDRELRDGTRAFVEREIGEDADNN